MTQPLVIQLLQGYSRLIEDTNVSETLGLVLSEPSTKRYNAEISAKLLTKFVMQASRGRPFVQSTYQKIIDYLDLVYFAELSPGIIPRQWYYEMRFLLEQLLVAAALLARIDRTLNSTTELVPEDVPLCVVGIHLFLKELSPEFDGIRRSQTQKVLEDAELCELYNFERKPEKSET